MCGDVYISASVLFRVHLETGISSVWSFEAVPTEIIEHMGGVKQKGHNVLICCHTKMTNDFFGF